MTAYSDHLLRARLTAILADDTAKASLFLRALAVLYTANENDNVFDAKVSILLESQCKKEGLDEDDVLDAICAIRVGDG